MKMFLLAASLFWIHPQVLAQTANAPNQIVIDEAKPVEVTPPSRVTKKTAASLKAPNGVSAPQSITAIPNPTPAPPAPQPNPWKVVYFGEWAGPRFSNFQNISQTQAPDPNANPEYAQIDHSFKLAYAVAPSNYLGMQLRAYTPFDPTKGLTFKNFRVYATWKNMIDTKDVNMGGQLDLELPTTPKSQAATNIFTFNLKLNWELKTSLRNWSFTALTLIRPLFYSSPVNQTSLYAGFFPWITVDLAPDWQLLFEGSFDASHSYQEVLFEFNASDPDYIDVGPLWSINSHVTVNLAWRQYVTNFSISYAVPYASLQVAL